VNIDSVFLDRDGVINEKPAEGGYVTSWGDFHFNPGALDALSALHRSGIRLIVITNQRGVARGTIKREMLVEIHERLVAECDIAGARIEAIYVCEHETGRCECRKPAPGLLLRAKSEYPDIDFARSLVVGDSASDLEAGWRLGCQLMLLAHGERLDAEARRLSEAGVITFGVAPSLADAVEAILRTRKGIAR